MGIGWMVVLLFTLPIAFILILIVEKVSDIIEWYKEGKKMVGINLWDDYAPGDETYLYVEGELEGDEHEKEILEEIFPHLGDVLKPRMFYYEAIVEYPKMIGTDMEQWFRDSKRWEIRLTIDWNDRDDFIEYLSGIKELKKFDFYSES